LLKTIDTKIYSTKRLILYCSETRADATEYEKSIVDGSDDDENDEAEPLETEGKMQFNACYKTLPTRYTRVYLGVRT